MSPICPEIGTVSNGWSAFGSSPSGHVFRVDRARGPVWYAKYRLPDGRQVQKKLGPAWTERGPPAGRLLHQAPGRGLAARHARRGAPRHAPGMVRTGATFAGRRGRVPALLPSTTGAASRRRSAATARTSTPPPARVRRARSRRSRPPRSRRGARRCSTGAAPLSNATRTSLLVLLHGVIRRAARSGGCR
jgi:hypothetical protein